MPVDRVDLLLLKGIADTASFAGAARTVGMTRAVATRRLRRLERRLELRLLNGEERVAITPAGRTLLAAGWAFVVAIAVAARRLSGTIAGRPAGIPRLRLAGFGRNWEGFADDLATHVPGVLLDVSGCEPAGAVELYNRYGVDALYAWEVPERAIAPVRPSTVLTVLAEPLWVALPATHPSARGSAVSLRSLAADRWITGTSEQARQLVHAACLAEGFTPHIGYTVDSAATARSMISHAVGVALVSPLTPTPCTGAGIVVRPLRDAPRRRHVLAVDPAVVHERLAGALVNRLRRSYLSAAAQRNPAYLRAPDFPVPPPLDEIELDSSLAAGLRPEAADSLPVDLDDLHLLRAVRDAGSMNRAARVLLISQPALSRRINRLERNLGVTLFVRTHRGAGLTPVGTELLAGVTEAEAAFRAVLQSIRHSPT